MITAEKIQTIESQKPTVGNVYRTMEVEGRAAAKRMIQRPAFQND